MEIKKIDFNDFGGRGVWKTDALKDWLKENAKPKTAIAVKLEDFYKEFYSGSKVIKYASYYSRKHIIDAMRSLQIKGLVAVSNGMLKIRFE